MNTAVGVKLTSVEGMRSDRKMVLRAARRIGAFLPTGIALAWHASRLLQPHAASANLEHSTMAVPGTASGGASFECSLAGTVQAGQFRHLYDRLLGLCEHSAHSKMFEHELLFAPAGKHVCFSSSEVIDLATS